jgi:hypothetical protein
VVGSATTTSDGEVVGNCISPYWEAAATRSLENVPSENQEVPSDNVPMHHFRGHFLCTPHLVVKCILPVGGVSIAEDWVNDLYEIAWKFLQDVQINLYEKDLKLKMDATMHMPCNVVISYDPDMERYIPLRIESNCGQVIKFPKVVCGAMTLEENDQIQVLLKEGWPCSRQVFLDGTHRDKAPQLSPQEIEFKEKEEQRKIREFDERCARKLQEYENQKRPQSPEPSPGAASSTDPMPSQAHFGLFL